MAKRSVDYHWRLREVMAGHGYWKTTDLVPLLGERGVNLSPAQVYRLVAQTPERLSLHTLAALCDIFGCEPNDLVQPFLVEAKNRRRAAGETDNVVELNEPRRPTRARIIEDE